MSEEIKEKEVENEDAVQKIIAAQKSLYTSILKTLPEITSSIEALNYSVQKYFEEKDPEYLEKFKSDLKLKKLESFQKHMSNLEETIKKMEA